MDIMLKNVIGETMETSIKSRYTNEILDSIFRYFMRMVLHLQNSGIEKLPLENDFEEPLKSFMNIAVDLIIDGQPPDIYRKKHSDWMIIEWNILNSRT